MYAIYRTQKFEKEISKKFSTEELKEVENFEKLQLINNPYIGDPLGYRFFSLKETRRQACVFLNL